ELFPAKVIDGTMLRGGHQPSAGIVRNARLRPPLEGRDESILCELLGYTDIADDAGEASDEPGRLDPPHGIDCAMGQGRRHGYPSHHLQMVRASRLRRTVNSRPFLGCLREEPLLRFAIKVFRPDIWRISVLPSQPGQSFL